MKKALITLLIAAAVSTSLTACGNKGGSAPAAQTSASTTPEAAQGETVDVGEFTVYVPGGWFKYPQTDMFGEKDADGKSPIAKDCYSMIKGGEKEVDCIDHPTIRVNYYKDSKAEDQLTMTTMWFEPDAVTEIEVTVNGKKVPAVEVLQLDSLSEEEAYYVNDYVYIPTEDGKSCFQVIIPVDMIDYEGVKPTDADVMSIMESLKAK